MAFLRTILAVYILSAMFCIAVIKGQDIKGSIGLKYFSYHYTTENGLPSNETYAILEDRKGYIWIGTDRGLVRYDGYDFNVYTQADGLTDNVIFDIFEDDQGKLWFSTFNNQVSTYSDHEGFGSYKYNHTIDSLIGTNEPSFLASRIYLDSLNNLLVQDYSRGYLEIRKNGNGEFNHYKGYSYLDIITHNDIKFSNDLIGPDFSLECDKVGCYISYPLIRKAIKEKSDTIALNYQYYHMDSMDVNLSKSNARDSIINMKVDHAKGNYFINFFQNQKAESLTLHSQFNLNSDVKILLESESVCESIIDRNDGIWVSTLNSGVYYFPNLAVKKIDLPIKVRGIIKNGSNVDYMSEDFGFTYFGKDKILLNGYSDEGLDLMSSGFWNSIGDESYKFYNHLDGGRMHSIWGLQKSKEKKYLWHTQVISCLNDNSIDTVLTSTERITAFHALDSLRLLVGKLNGLYYIKEGNLIEYPFRFGTINTRVQDIKYDNSNKVLYVATLGDGIYIIKEDALIAHLRKGDGLNSNSVNQLFLDVDNKLWIATNAGINYLNNSDDTISIRKLFPSTKYYNSKNISQILVMDSVVHIGTDLGAGMVDLKSFTLEKSDTIPVYLTHFSINDVEVSIDSFENLILNHDQNNIKIGYIAPSLSKFGDINYRYRLRGSLQSDWTYSQNTSAEFQNLSPSQYNFDLQCQDVSLKWHSLKKGIGFSIKKPFWKTVWFFILSIFLVTVGIFFIFLRYINAQKKRAQLLNELNNTKQMAINSQLNPHFIFNSLNSIQNFILKNERNLSNDYLGKFSVLMRKVFENSKELYISLQDELDAIKAYLELESVRYGDSFIFEMNVELIHSPKEIKVPSLILQPVVENAINHGIIYLEGRKGQINLKITDDLNFIFIEVLDNGMGREHSEKKKSIINHKSSGLELTKRRIALLSQQYNKPARLEIRDLTDDQNKPLGTQVNIKIPKLFANG